ncbi:MAG: amidohydrolase family protein [Candidatus Thalassarchaeaceae archaeon]|tara:strand:- start:15686 stop:16966 length:1281 start_codon:yes stop_codon:yes gene_type:complete
MKTNKIMVIIVDIGLRRIINTTLLDHDGLMKRGNFLIDKKGNYSISNGDEDVIETIDGSNRLVTRSLQNWHTHMAMILNRSMGEGLPLKEWLQESIWPVEKKLTKEFIEIGSKAAAAELISTGTTFACDMYFHPEVVGNVISDTGLRAIICGPITDFPFTSSEEPGSALNNVKNLISEGSSTPERVEYGIGNHSVYACSEETLQKSSEISKETGCKLSIHTSETRQEVADCHARTGMYPIEYLDSIDYFTEGTVCAHCGWVTKKEMRILASHDAHAVHCPTSNQKLACGGTMSYPAMKEAGVDIRLGTDGAASNNSLDLRAEAKIASLLQRHDHWDARILNPKETWNLATRDSIDWVTWDLDDIRMRPYGKNGRRLLSNLIYSGANCLDVFVEGKVLRRNGVTKSLNENEVAKELENAVTDYYSDI